MPKKFDDLQKKQWLKFYEQGKSEKWIANRAGCDVRTVKNALNEARLKRDVVVARMELVKDALRKHQDGLLEELDRIMSYLVVPPKDFFMLSWYRGGNSIFNDAGEQIKEEGGGDSAMRRLLKEHLKNDKLWRVLRQWEKVKADHLAAKATFQRKTATVLQDKTGYKLIDSGGTPPFIHSDTAGKLVYKAAIDMAFAAPDEKAQENVIRKIEMTISVRTDTGEVLLEKHSALAVAPGNEEPTRQHLLDALKDLGKSPEVKAVVETYWAFEQITTKARQVVEDIRLLGLVPGHCEICRRLGM